MGRNFALSMQRRESPTDVVSRSRYNQLRNRLFNLTQWLHQEHQKVEKLSGLRDRTVLEGANFMLADVITASIRGPHNELIINRGKTDGLAKDQFVLGDYSVIGTVADIDSHTARVKLVTDSTSKIAIKIGELGARMIMQGYGNNSAKVELLSRKHKIKIGDVVYTQKKPGFLDVPMIVGTVAQCKTDDKNPLLWDITVESACEVNRLKNVTVVVTGPQEQLSGTQSALVLTSK
jgi:rod shape-determining protein MreC